MGNASSSQKVSAQDKAILDLKNQRDSLHRYQKRIASITAHETEVAKQCLANGHRDRALLALRRKKFQESLLSKADAQLEQLQRLMADVEFAQLQKAVLYGLQQGTAVLKQIHAEMGGIQGVEKLLEENAEARAYTEEISDMLAGQLSRADEEEVDEELKRLEDALQEPDLPEVPVKGPKVRGIDLEQPMQTNKIRQHEGEMLPA